MVHFSMDTATRIPCLPRLGSPCGSKPRMGHRHHDPWNSSGRLLLRLSGYADRPAVTSGLIIGPAVATALALVPSALRFAVPSVCVPSPDFSTAFSHDRVQRPAKYVVARLQPAFNFRAPFSWAKAQRGLKPAT